MNIKEYIDSGIIERYLLGLATPEQEAELQYLREIYPVLRREAEAVELRLETMVFEEAVKPPPAIKTRVMDEIREPYSHESYNGRNYTNNNNDTYIHLNPGWKRQITVSVWWRCAFIAMCVALMALAATTLYLHNQVQRLQDVIIHHNYPSPPATR
ncbi:hypothetical protein SAMN05444266_107420 [Chitinophaga jiangningensis]|uniref:Zinc-finger n=1 Tax=Chitinophaga jiangningensis TaxID=1419482 RepID=A0A1M7HXJ9_9BACT|nr:hypothetical protein [Chitinophaga jiangningensis]SHM33138.1 hypothetical protein SAMN05444266_107420 [Chitinophaga jiangningensis]